MIKRTVAFFLILFSMVLKVGALSSDDISADCAVLMTVQSGDVIFAHNENQKHSMASTTKIMTSLLAVESGRLQNEVKVKECMLKVEGTSMGLLPGDSVSIEELCYGMLLSSGNDAANTVAFYLAGTIKDFAYMMNERAKQIGMNNTCFVTPSGLDDKNHYSTAYDMALLGREAVGNPEFLKICSSKKATLTYGNPPYSRTLYNHNRLLSSYDYIYGIKTGFTKKSGRCLVTFAQRDGVGLIAVTLGDPNDWYDHKLMLDYGFETVKAKKIKPNLPDNISVVGGVSDSVTLSVQDAFVESTAEDIDFCYRIPRFVYAPIKVGDIVGYVDIYLSERLVESVPITAKSDIQIKKRKQ